MTPPKIRLLLSDVDGTLVTSDKVLTERAIEAVNELQEAGILFAITSSRPPGGLKMFSQPLKLTTPISAFNGGFVTTPDMEVTDKLAIDDDVIRPLLALIADHECSTWVYQGEQWFVQDLNGPRVQREAEVVQFQPHLVTTFDDVCTQVAKIVVVEDDTQSMAATAASVRDRFGDRVSATNSQSYYLDITNPQANKGVVVKYLSNMYDISTDEIATIGDAQNDVSMFVQSGVSVAMGNADDEVQASATYVTTSNNDEGFANAVHEFILQF